MDKLAPEEALLINDLYVEQFLSLKSYAQAILGDESSAEEAVQETFRTACSRIDEVITSPNRVGWLFLTLRNTISNMQRSRNRMARIMFYATAELLNNCSDETVQEMGLDTLYNDLAGTPDFELIKKLAIDRCTFAEIAEEQGASIAACKQRAYRARKRLREKMTDREDDEP